jgi:hypothetical protein
MTALGKHTKKYGRVSLPIKNKTERAVLQKDYPIFIMDNMS